MSIFTSFPIFFRPQGVSTIAKIVYNQQTPDEKEITLSDVKKSFTTQNFPFQDVLKYLEEYIEIYLLTDNNSKDNIPIGIRKKLQPKSKFTNLYGLFADTQFIFYVPLHLIVFFINKFIQDSSTSKKLTLINENSIQEYFTFDNYVNISPYICVAPIIPTYNTTVYPFRSFRNESKVITDIWVSTEAFGNTLQDFIRSEDDPENFDIVSFLKSFLKKIETALGGINEFDLEYSEEENIFTIVDRKFSNPPKKEDIPVINTFGAASIALDLSIQTKITNKLGAQISIAAQGPDGEAQFNSSMPEFKKWNKNLIDRFDKVNQKTQTTGTYTVLAPPREGNNTVLSPENSQNREISAQELLSFDPLNPSKQTLKIAKPVQKSINEQQEEDIRKKANAFYSKLEELYKKWNEGKADEDDGWASIATQGQTFYSMIASDYKLSKQLPPQGIIPTVISLKVEGVGGVKIGQTFRINEGILPKRYAQFGYIVTGIDHAIENNKWVTEIKAQTYYIGIPDSNEVSIAKERLNRFLPFRENGIRRVITPEDISQANQERQPFNTVPADATSTAPTPKQIGPVDDNRRFWTLVAVCSREDNNPQGWADVAQSIYNRTLGGSRIGYKSDVVAQILGVWQYEPTWKFPKLGKVSIPNPQWFRIKDLQTASAASGLSPARLQQVAQALKNSSLQQNARNFVQGRTDFLGANQPATKMKQKVQRSGGNKFGFNWNYQPQAGGTPAPVPGYVTNAKI